MADNLARIKERIGSAPVRLVAVTKNIGPREIEEAWRSGVTEFGENRVQDALAKQRQLAPAVQNHVNWHFIGHLQTNKAKKVVGEFVLIHSVDSLRLAEELSRQSLLAGVVQPVLLQIKVVSEDTKFGFTPDELKGQFWQIYRLPALKVEGLMTMAPFGASAGALKHCFTGLKLLKDELEREFGVRLRELSMGMSNDYTEAIACGATLIRLGRAVFKTGNQDSPEFLGADKQSRH